MNKELLKLLAEVVDPSKELGGETVLKVNAELDKLDLLYRDYVTWGLIFATTHKNKCPEYFEGVFNLINKSLKDKTYIPKEFDQLMISILDNKKYQSMKPSLVYAGQFVAAIVFICGKTFK